MISIRYQCNRCSKEVVREAWSETAAKMVWPDGWKEFTVAKGGDWDGISLDKNFYLCDTCVEGLAGWLGVTRASAVQVLFQCQRCGMLAYANMFIDMAPGKAHPEGWKRIYMTDDKKYGSPLEAGPFGVLLCADCLNALEGWIGNKPSGTPDLTTG